MVTSKSDFAAKLQTRVPEDIASKAAAGRIVSAFLDQIEDELKEQNTVRFIGFGSFGVVVRPKRKYRNPQDGKMHTLPEKKVPKFTAGKALKESVAAKRRGRTKKA